MNDKRPLQTKYHELFSRRAEQFCGALLQGPHPLEDYAGIPQPFLPLWGKGYETAALKMAFIGKETRGWGSLVHFVKASREERMSPRSLGLDEFQDMDFVEVGWGCRNCYTFWGFVLYFLAALHRLKDWTILKQRERHPEILNNFVWGNVNAIETWLSRGIGDGVKPHAWAYARSLVQPWNSFLPIQEIFAPQVVLLLCKDRRGAACDEYLEMVEKELVWEKRDMRLFRTRAGTLVFNMPHPTNMKYSQGADFYVSEIITQLREDALLPEAKA